MPLQSKSEAIMRQCLIVIRKIKKRPLIVGITGDSGSGKSYFAKIFCEVLSNTDISYTYINADEFMLPRYTREENKKKFYTAGKHKGKSYYEILENMFRLDEFRSALISLKKGKNFAFYPYERSSGDFSKKKKKLMPNQLIVIDSMVLLDMMDFIIYIKTNQANIIKRKIQRDSDIRTKDQIIQLQKIQSYHWKTNEPKNPDIIVNNNDLLNPRMIVLSK